jgi:hypothetical protein
VPTFNVPQHVVGVGIGLLGDIPAAIFYAVSGSNGYKLFS